MHHPVDSLIRALRWAGWVCLGLGVLTGIAWIVMNYAALFERRL